MLVWRNSMYRDDGSHIGYGWFGTREDAERAAAKRPDLFKDPRAKIGQMFDTGHGKAPMIQFLNRVADHPDNG